MEEILKQIVDKRIETISKKGITFGINIPEKRLVPIKLPDFKKGVLISEIKRGSPSEGKMKDIANPTDWAKLYIDGGANVISILTEEDYFFGSLNDLINIKNKFPEITVLRKDFLLSVEEVDISYHAGSDMILLITGILDIGTLSKMKNRAEELGMMPLIEVHTEEELNKILPLNPKLIGINSRDLKTFKIDRNYPVALKEKIPESTFVIFESGIRNYTDAFFAGSNGFSGVLVGTSIVKNGDLKEKIMEIKSGFLTGLENKSDFYRKIFKKIYLNKKPFVKICGITNYDDAKTAVESGADAVGFIFAESPRKIDFETAKEISMKLGKNVLKVGVVVNENIQEAAKAVRDGWLSAIQFHGEQNNNECMEQNVCWYKAIRVKDENDFKKKYYSPIILFDAFSKEAEGGTGKRIDDTLLSTAIKNNIKLYLAGGISNENVGEIIKKYQPLMLDACSGLEESPGKKDKNKLKIFFDEISKQGDLK